jgi:phage terminase large subunit-like protein
MLAITTAGMDQQGICYSQREYVTRILKGIIEDDSFWGIIYAIDTKKDWPDLEQDDDWQDEANWYKANPLLGISKKLSTMQQDANEAANKPMELNQFLRWHLNVWTQASTRWVNPIHWAACGELPVYEDELDGRPAYAGLDLAQIYDLAALALVFPPESEGEPFKVVCRFWLPEDNMADRVRRDQVPYDVWARLGFITLTPGNVIDYDFIEAEVMELAGRFRLGELAYDRYGASQISQHLQEAMGDEWVVPIGQGFISMSPPMKELGRLIASKQLAHGNNPVLNWMADNLVAREDAAGNIKPDKEKSREKIDGCVALIMAIDRATRGEAGSVYEDRGIIVL